MPPQERWAELARAVRQRRGQLGLSQGDLAQEDRGGPSRETVRMIESQARTSYRPQTYGQLDTALGWEPGTAAAIKDGLADSVPGLWRVVTDSAGVTDSVQVTRRSGGLGRASRRSVDPDTGVVYEYSLVGTEGRPVGELDSDGMRALHALALVQRARAEKTPLPAAELVEVENALRVALADAMAEVGEPDDGRADMTDEEGISPAR